MSTPLTASKMNPGQLVTTESKPAPSRDPNEAGLLQAIADGDVQGVLEFCRTLPAETLQKDHIAIPLQRFRESLQKDADDWVVIEDTPSSPPEEEAPGFWSSTLGYVSGMWNYAGSWWGPAAADDPAAMPKPDRGLAALEAPAGEMTQAFETELARFLESESLSSPDETDSRVCPQYIKDVTRSDIQAETESGVAILGTLSSAGEPVSTRVDKLLSFCGNDPELAFAVSRIANQTVSNCAFTTLKQSGALVWDGVPTDVFVRTEGQALCLKRVQDAVELRVNTTLLVTGVMDANLDLVVLDPPRPLLAETTLQVFRNNDGTMGTRVVDFSYRLPA